MYSVAVLSCCAFHCVCIYCWACALESCSFARHTDSLFQFKVSHVLCVHLTVFCVHGQWPSMFTVSSQYVHGKLHGKLHGKPQYRSTLYLYSVFTVSHVLCVHLTAQYVHGNCQCTWPYSVLTAFSVLYSVLYSVFTVSVPDCILPDVCLRSVPRGARHHSPGAYAYAGDDCAQGRVTGPTVEWMLSRQSGNTNARCAGLRFNKLKLRWRWVGWRHLYYAVGDRGRGAGLWLYKLSPKPAMNIISGCHP